MSDPVSSRYELVIGLEVHAQLKTESKLFSPAPVGFGAEPNHNVEPVCLALQYARAYTGGVSGTPAGCSLLLDEREKRLGFVDFRLKNRSRVGHGEQLAGRDIVADIDMQPSQHPTLQRFRDRRRRNLYDAVPGFQPAERRYGAGCRGNGSR